MGVLLDTEKDLLIAAGTASGKTEAAFLPICHLLRESPGSTVRALSICPLKALINDQHRRLNEICHGMGIPVHRRHGDVSGLERKRLMERPGGILLITPESLEATLMRQGPSLQRLFGDLAYVIVDEVHSFIGSERGRQLQSLLHRLEMLAQKGSPRRVGLSATIGDLGHACEFLRHNNPKNVHTLLDQKSGGDLLLQVLGYEVRSPNPIPTPSLDEDALTTPREKLAEQGITVAVHLFSNLRGEDNLIFPNSRNQVERFADMLSTLCERAKVPNEFFPHHGSLSKELREELEARLKKSTVEAKQPLSVICTSTLEMGIDIGSVASIAQIGAPPSVASLRQRLGRSGRRNDESAILRLYIEEPERTPENPPQDLLRAELFQAVAMVELLLRRWCEPPPAAALHLSTLVQQVLSLMAQHGGITAEAAYRILCQTGPFANVDEATFAETLRSLGRAQLIFQDETGLLLPTERGEGEMNSYSFYAAFEANEEYRLVTGGKTLGTLPVTFAVMEDTEVIFAGRRWRVRSVNEDSKTIMVEPSKGGAPPKFVGSRLAVHHRVRQRMLALYRSEETPAYLDEGAQRLIAQGRGTFRRLNLAECPVTGFAGETLIFTWQSDRVIDTLTLMLRTMGLKASRDGVAITVEEARPKAVLAALASLRRQTPPEAETLAASVRNKLQEKWDWVLSDDLMNREHALRRLDVPGALAWIEILKA